MKYYICLGSNLRNRRKNLKAAVRRMKQRGMRIVTCSSLYVTEPVKMPGDAWFYNQVIEVETDLNPSDLLTWIKKTEQNMGRSLAEKLKPRVIDMDILLAGDLVIRTDELKVPHPELEVRNFVLVPLTEIAPDVIHPVLNKKIRVLLSESKDSHQVKILNRSPFGTI
jgi:2-amino-4-hydroxy-6-hydroxymethyldihydropteridine diphosphokinase